MEEIIPDVHKEQRTEGQVGSEPMVVGRAARQTVW